MLAKNLALGMNAAIWMIVLAMAFSMPIDKPRVPMTGRDKRAAIWLSIVMIFVNLIGGFS